MKIAKTIVAVLLWWFFDLGKVFASEGFFESFSGTGDFSSVGVRLEGFDNPGWILRGQGEFRDDGLWFENKSIISVDGDRLSREQLWTAGDFVNIVMIRDHRLERPAELSSASVVLGDILGPGSNAMMFTVQAVSLRDEPPAYRAVLRSGSILEAFDVTPGPHLLMSMSFDAESSTVTFRYDNNLDDDQEPHNLATFFYDGTVNELHDLVLNVGASDVGEADALIDFWSFSNGEEPPVRGDFNRNLLLEVEDLDLLAKEVREGTNNLEFDLVRDGVVDEFDISFWVHNLSDTFFGDSNLDGEFNTNDLVDVFVGGEYEDSVELNSTWAEGDWNGDGDFTSRDLVLAFGDGGYELGPRQALHAVPEPDGVLIPYLVLGILLRLRLNRRLFKLA